ncbi:MAG TPA: bifunctional diguanylate cyclase/phosphodiesterase [Candidatus Saccharimonadales bacterium]|nr:bifunctional diguanylate cyclase/phosphodiesterase [Candidatus Saccharimonadales bacterium]
MSIAHPRLRAATLAERAGRAPRWVVGSYALMGTLLFGYFISLMVRGPNQSVEAIDGWGVGAFEVVVSGLCLWRAIGSRRRAVPLLLGLGILSWSIGDTVLAAESAGGGAPAVPSLADLFWLGFYPIIYVALLLLTRRHLARMGVATWLDGAVAGLGAAALCACFAFNTILHSVGGSATTVATDLAYPIGDALLLMLAVGGTAMIPGRKSPQWLLIACAIACTAVGDTFNLFASSGSSSHLGTILNGVAWPCAILLISMAVWVRPLQSSPLAPSGSAGFLLPGLGACAGLSILLVDTLHQVTPVAIGLATATLITVGARLALSVRSLRILTERRHRQAITDELTGLGNRRQLFNLLDAFFADYADPDTVDRRLSLLYVDLDHFKEINDSFGHGAGDEVLRQLGPRLTSRLRDSDVLVRVGGDELAVLVVDTDSDYAATVAQRLIAELEQPFVLDTLSVRVGASIGIASAPADATDSVALLRCADLAMYRAKVGPAPYEVYRHEVDDAGNRLRLVDELRGAIVGGDLEVHYQPQVDLISGRLSSMEALVRWSHPRLGLIPPLDFIPLAEEAGLMQSLTALVLERAVEQCAAWHAAGQTVTVSVNVSATNLLDVGFSDTVMATLARHDVAPASLILEITETTIIRDFDLCKLVIEQLRKLGLGVSIDDFGAGVTSLAYLGSLAVSELKLDRSFLTRLATGDTERNLALVRATIALGHKLNMRVVAEGIEDVEALNLLAEIGCDLAQGYFISKPMSARDLGLASSRVDARSRADTAVA